MKKYTLLFLLFIIALNVKSQNQTEYTGVADYSIRLAEDVFLFDGKLIFNNTKSAFVYKKNKKTKWFRDNEDDFKTQKIFTDINGYQIFTDLINKELIVREFCREKQALIYNDKVNIKWQLENEQKEISGLKCAKASTHFRGRDYTVWYALNIPSNAGPWKFNGLPGLIVMAEDKMNEVFITLTKLQINTHVTMPELANGKKVSLNEFQKCLDEAYREEVIKNEAIIAQMQAQAEANGDDVEIGYEAPQKRPTTELEFE